MGASLQLPGGFKTLNPVPEISRYYNNAGTTYTNTTQVLSEVVVAARYVGQTFLIGDKEYWFKTATADANLVLKSDGDKYLEKQIAISEVSLNAVILPAIYAAVNCTDTPNGTLGKLDVLVKRFGTEFIIQTATTFEILDESIKDNLGTTSERISQDSGVTWSSWRKLKQALKIITLLDTVVNVDISPEHDDCRIIKTNSDDGNLFIETNSSLKVRKGFCVEITNKGNGLLRITAWDGVYIYTESGLDIPPISTRRFVYIGNDTWTVEGGGGISQSEKDYWNAKEDSEAKKETVVATGGTLNDLATPTSLLRFTNQTTPVIITGLANPDDGKKVILENNTLQSINILHQSVSSALLNRLKNNNNQDLIIQVGGAAEYVYSQSQTTWVLTDLWGSDYLPTMTGTTKRALSVTAEGYPVADDIVELKTWMDAQTTILTSAQLNTIYPTYKKGQEVICQNITTGPVRYEKVDDSTGEWIAVALTKASVDAGGGRGAGVTTVYKKYVALMTQQTTEDPAATVLENTLGGTIVWTRQSAGVYIGTLSGSSFTVDKTMVTITPNSNHGNAYSVMIVAGRTDAFTVYIITKYTDNVGTCVDGFLSKTPVEIRVYN